MKNITITLTSILCFVLVSCSSTDSGASCLSSGTSSIDNDSRIHSETEGCVAYKQVTLNRTDMSSSPVTMDYMVHTAVGTAKGLVVLIAGGDLDAKISDDNNDGLPDFASGNFLVRSAHLFADQGYQVVTIDRPSDYVDYSVVSGYDYDPYRISADHTADLQHIIGVENTTGLPVFIAGTSRGAISAVHNASLTDGISLSSPVTSGTGSYLGSIDTDPTAVNVPTQVIWHQNDACSVSTPANSQLIATQFINAFGGINTQEITGGFNRVGYTDISKACKGQTYHGFMGVEVQAVQATTAFFDTIVGGP